MQSGGFDDVYGNNIQKALDDLDKYTKQAIDNLKSIDEQIEETRESMFDAIDQVQEKLEKQQNLYDYVNDSI